MIKVNFMSVRLTSKDCYDKMNKGKLLSGERLRVYNALYHLKKPSTSREIFAKMNLARPQQARVTELVKLGVVCEKGTRKCSVTGMTVIQYALTNELPKLIPKRLSVKEKINRLNIMLDKVSYLAPIGLMSDIEAIKDYLKNNF